MNDSLKPASQTGCGILERYTAVRRMPGNDKPFQADREFAAMLDPDPANEGKLLQRIGEARAADLPRLHSFTRGLDIDIKAATAAVTLPHHNGRTEGVNNIKTKMIKRQMFGRADFELLRHRILPG